METKRLPVIALRGLVVLPGMTVHFDVSRKISAAALEAGMEREQLVFLAAQREPETEEPTLEDLYRHGTIAYVRQMVKLSGQMIRVVAEGRNRAWLAEIGGNEEYMEGEVMIADLPEAQETVDELSREAMVRILHEQIEEYGRENVSLGKQVVPQLLRHNDLNALLYQTGGGLPLSWEQKQKILEQEDIVALFQTVEKILNFETEIYRIKREFQGKVKTRIDKNQKEYILREQMKVIREELGDENADSESEKYQEKLRQIKVSDEVRQKLSKEINRFRAIPGGSQEGTVLKNYLDTVFELPWNERTEENLDIRHAEDVLNEDHYGLIKVKERILEHLAVRALTKKGDAPIICLVGPPGTGKTSIARSVARALNRKYVRICLGGVRDEAEIRGHRKTYVGAMPGRFIEGLRLAKVNNPLMLLDEVDKVSSDYKGDVSSALLEVLDSEQNNRFVDHYVEVPVDLSQVFFIATANTVQTIPGPLLDRMEVIEVSSYTENEKFHIAKDFLVVKQREKNGLKPEQLVFTDEGLKKIIHNYTREAGVRSLERKIGDICRKTAREILEGDREKTEVTAESLEHFLGKEKYSFEEAGNTDEIGIVRGLAWTSVGGDTLEIEVNVMPGSGKVLLTGKLGDVMKESAQTAISYIRSIGEEHGLEADYFDTHDIHIHIPEGAVPKDGPSAGVTMATAIFSAVTGRPVRADAAMTGEITLRGRVLPIGGLKEKLLAAKMAHIKLVFVPEKNRPDVAELSPEITDGLEICYVKQVSEIWKRVLKRARRKK